MYKLRATDTLCVGKYAHIKPEVEIEFNDSKPLYEAEHQLRCYLASLVDAQLQWICERCDIQDFRAIQANPDVDKRLKEYAVEFQKSNQK